MLKFIRADLYKAYHRPYLLILTGILALLVTLVNLSFMSSPIVRETALQQMYRFLFLPLFFVSMFVDVTIAEEIKHGTLKNTVSFGINRTQLYISKLLSASIIGLITAVIVGAALLGSACLFIKPGAGFSHEFLTDYLMRMGTAFVLYLGAASLAHMMAIVLKKSSVFAVAFAGMILVPPALFMILGSTVSPVFTDFEKVMLLPQCNGLACVASSEFPTAILIGIAHYVIFAMLGIYIFNRQEIN